MAKTPKTTIKRKGVFLSIRETAREWQLLEGNRILSRHTSHDEVAAAFDAEQAARSGRRTPVSA